MVKKLTYIFLLLCCFQLFVKAQKKEFKPEWNLGVGVGPTFSSVNFAYTRPSLYTHISTSSLQQYHGGVAVRYISEKSLGIIVELNYSQQGWKENFKESQPANFPPFAYTRQLNYIELPMLTHIYFGNKIRFFFNIGPKFSYLLSDKENINDALIDYISSGLMPESFTSYQYYRDVDRRFDYGLMGGAGLEFRSLLGNFVLEGRYYFGLGDIFSNNRTDFFARSANRVTYLRLTYYTKFLK